MPGKHGATGYKAGCRCDVCRAGKTEEMRRYVAQVRSRDGQSPTQKYRPAKGVTCDWCDAPVRSWSGRARDGLTLCTLHRRRKRWAETERDWISRPAREAIYERDRWVCGICSQPVDPSLSSLDDMAASLDHIVPRSHTLFPDHSAGNLRLAHRLCNSLRGDRLETA